MKAIRNGLVLPGWLSGASPLQWAGLAIDTLWEWRRRRRSRHQLKMMGEHICKDIGISRADAWCEARKPFWKV